MNEFLYYSVDAAGKKENKPRNKRDHGGGGEEYFRHGNMDMWEGNKI